MDRKEQLMNGITGFAYLRFRNDGIRPNPAICQICFKSEMTSVTDKFNIIPPGPEQS